VVRRKLSATAGDDPARRTRRIASALARKGYGAGVAYQAIREVLGEELHGDADGPVLADADLDLDGSDGV
jgi:regulatory protein